MLIALCMFFPHLIFIYVSLWFHQGGRSIKMTKDPAAAADSFQLCPTLCDPMDYSPPDSSVHGILQARILEWVAVSSPGIFPGLNPHHLRLLHWQAGSLLLCHLGV